MAVCKLVRVHWFWGLFLVLLLLSIGACGGNDSPDADAGGGTVDLDEALDQVIKLYDEMLDVLTGVADEASAVAAADDLTRIAIQIEELEQRMGEYSEAEVTGAALWSSFLNSRLDISDEFDRISASPAALDLVSDALENLE